MTLKEKLKAAGYTDEQIEGILKLHNEELADAYVPIDRFNQVNEGLKESKTQLENERKTHQEQITQLQKTAGDAEKHKETVAELTRKNEEAQAQYNADLVKSKKIMALKVGLNGKVHDVNDAIEKFDLTKIELDDKDNIISGFTEQEKTLRKDKSYLFVSDPEPEGGESGNLFKPKGFKFQDSQGEDGKGPTKAQQAVTFAKTLAQGKEQARTEAATAAEYYSVGGTK